MVGSALSPTSSTVIYFSADSGGFYREGMQSPAQQVWETVGSQGLPANINSHELVSKFGLYRYVANVALIFVWFRMSCSLLTLFKLLHRLALIRIAFFVLEWHALALPVTLRAVE